MPTSGLRLEAVVAAATVAAKQLLMLKIYVVLAVVQPLAFLTIAGLLSSSEAYLRDAMLGAGVMGMWSTTLFGAGGMLDRERRYGTMEHLLVTPGPLLGPVLGACLGASALGLLSMLTSYGVGWAAFGVRLPLARWPALLAASLAALPALAALGVLLAGMFVLLRQTRMLINLLEYPVWICSGLLVPLEALPAALRLAGLGLTPTWAMQLLRATADGQASAAATALLPLVLLSAGCVGLAVVLVRRVEHLARGRGDLSFV